MQFRRGQVQEKSLSYSLNQIGSCTRVTEDTSSLVFVNTIKMMKIPTYLKIDF